MRTARWLAPLLSVLSIPAIAEAQPYYYPPPPPVYAPPPPRVYIEGRIKWHVRRRPIVIVQGGASVIYAPAPPPAVVYAPPPPAYYYAPQPEPVYIAPPEPIYGPMPVAAAVVRAPEMQWESRFGLGVSASDVVNNVQEQRAGDNGFGFAAQLRYRVSRHWSTELMLGYDRSTVETDLAKTDVPATFGLMLHLLGPEHALSPYFVGAAGLNFADMVLVDAPGTKIEDQRTQALAQLGGGLELRIGPHLAINADVRVEGRWNLDQPSDSVKATTSVNGKSVYPIADSTALRVGVGATMYF